MSKGILIPALVAGLVSGALSIETIAQEKQEKKVVVTTTQEGEAGKGNRVIIIKEGEGGTEKTINVRVTSSDGVTEEKKIVVTGAPGSVSGSEGRQFVVTDDGVKSAHVFITHEGAEPTGDVLKFAVGEPLTAGGTILGQSPNGQSFAFMQVTGNELPIENKIVKGAPYSADAVTEFTQTLADGNRIQRKSSSQIYRDSEGRTRREIAPMMIGMLPGAPTLGKSIQIFDPVANVTYLLDAESHTAVKSPPTALTLLRGTADKNVTWTAQRKIITTTKSENGGNVTHVETTVEPAPAGATTPTNIGVSKEIVTRIATARAVAGSQLPNMKQEKIGKQTIEGVEAEGTRTVETIAAGEIGNDRPIEIVNERWYSNDLQMVILSRHVDPRLGENVYRVTNINRAEPDSSLFRVPSDYTIKEGQFNIQRKIELKEKLQQ